MQAAEVCDQHCMQSSVRNQAVQIPVLFAHLGIVLCTQDMIQHCGLSSSQEPTQDCDRQSFANACKHSQASHLALHTCWQFDKKHQNQHQAAPAACSWHKAASKELVVCCAASVLGFLLCGSVCSNSCRACLASRRSAVSIARCRPCSSASDASVC